jgi:hypothetical protein
MRTISAEHGKIYIATSLWEKTRGVIGNEHLLTRGFFVIPHCNWVHGFFLHSPIYVYFLSASYTDCIHACTLAPNSFSPFVFKAQHVLESRTQISNDAFIEILRLLSA